MFKKFIIIFLIKKGDAIEWNSENRAVGCVILARDGQKLVSFSSNETYCEFLCKSRVKNNETFCARQG